MFCFRSAGAAETWYVGQTERSGNATFTPNDVEGFCEGSVGWATTNLKITLPDGKHVSPRWSAVFHREDGTWRFVQTHASLGIDNDKVGWVYPNK
jgi:hypothetical protein